MNERTGEGYSAEDRLPWLETVEEEYREPRSLGRIAATAVLALLVIGIAVAGYFWLQRNQGVAGNGELIEAQKGDYKVKPDQPGGMKVEGEGDQVFATSQGTAGNASINAGALPEAPVDGKKVAAGAPAAAGSKTAKLTVPAANQPQPRTAPTSAPAPAAGGAGSLIQIGAFPDEAGANTSWARMSKRFAYLAPLGKSVAKGESNGKAIWRLRVNTGSNGQARELCGRLRIAGENCFVTN